MCLQWTQVFLSSFYDMHIHDFLHLCIIRQNNQFLACYYFFNLVLSHIVLKFSQVYSKTLWSLVHKFQDPCLYVAGFISVRSHLFLPLPLNSTLPYIKSAKIICLKLFSGGLGVSSVTKDLGLIPRSYVSPVWCYDPSAGQTDTDGFLEIAP